MATQEYLKTFWPHAQDGRLCAREQAKAWALREVWREEGKGDHGLFSWVASRVEKTSNGKPTGANPTNSAMFQFFEKVDEDRDRYPGKHNGATRGPKRVLAGAKVTAIASAAKRLKAEGEEPTYAAVVAACPLVSCEDQGPNIKRNSHLSDSDRCELSLNIRIFVTCFLLNSVGV